MMRKTSVILLSAATGAALTLFVTQPRAVFMGSSARAATADTYRQLNLFGDVFERVRSDYVEQASDEQLIEAAVNGMGNALSDELRPRHWRKYGLDSSWRSLGSPRFERIC